MDINILGNMDNSDGTFESANRVYDSSGLAPTLPTCSGGGYSAESIGSRGVRRNG